MGRVEEVRKEARALEYESIVENLDYLGDPYDKMDIDTKKEHALSMYYEVLKVNWNTKVEINCQSRRTVEVPVIS